jgi:hypothetical protein
MNNPQNLPIEELEKLNLMIDEINEETEYE